MINFNRQNPLIILTKKAYIDYNQNLQSTVRSTVLYSIILVACLIVVTFFTFGASINAGMISIIFNILIFVSFVAYTYREIRFIVSDSDLIKEFDKVSNAQLNEILALNDEEVFHCLGSMRELNATVTCLKKFIPIYAALLGIVATFFSAAAVFFFG